MYKFNVVDRDEIQRQRWKRLEKENIFKRAEIVADYKISKSKSCSTILRKERLSYYYLLFIIININNVSFFG